MVVRSRFLALLLALVVVGAFSACGDDDDEGTGVDTTETSETTATTTQIGRAHV